MTLLSVPFLAAAAAWLAVSAVLLAASLAMKRLPAADALPGPPPRVSIVLAARDEGARLETTLRQLLAQQDVRIEVVVVDDRSRDETPAILSRLAAEFPALHALRIESLPAGWLGKCHALQRGSEIADGEWLLFMDGDVWLTPRAVRRALAAAYRERVEHLALTPHVRPANGRPASLLYEACVLPLQAILSVPIALANADSRFGFAGIGAFNLVRADAYRCIGGHASVRLDVADDMKLGLMLRRAGFRTRVFVGDTDVLCDYADDVPGLVKALEKNAFAATGFATGLSLVMSIGHVALLLLALSGPFVGGVSGVAALGTFASIALAGAAQARLSSTRVVAGLLAPLTLLLVAVILLNSLVVTLRQGGVRWRDTFYPIDALRAGYVRLF